ncbi:hypothetical protein J6590_080325 [Homalodisca vitripennis]|nr:hypothetical protein J6590_080325 [Homalodisca vitripennis]
MDMTLRTHFEYTHTPVGQWRSPLCHERGKPNEQIMQMSDPRPGNRPTRPGGAEVSRQSRCSRLVIQIVPRTRPVLESVVNDPKEAVKGDPTTPGRVGSARTDGKGYSPTSANSQGRLYDIIAQVSHSQYAAHKLRNDAHHTAAHAGSSGA